MKEKTGAVYLGFSALLLAFLILSLHVVPSEALATVTDDAYYEGESDSDYAQPEESMDVDEEAYREEEYYEDEGEQVDQDYQEPPLDADEEPFPGESPGEEFAPGLYEGGDLTPEGTVRWR